MLSQETLDILAKVGKLADNAPWNQSKPKRPPPPSPPPPTTDPDVTEEHQGQLNLLALIRSKATKPATQDHRSKPADIYEVRITAEQGWFACIVVDDPITRERPTLQQVSDAHRRRWGDHCETRRRRAR